MPPSIKQRSNLYKLGNFLDTMDEKYKVDLEDLDHMSADDSEIDNAETESKDINPAEKKRKTRQHKVNTKSQGSNLPRKIKSI